MRASHASCSIRFSLRMMISGAPGWRSRWRRLLRLITRRYRSFRSEVAKRPPSSWTMGRRSGGMTGRTDRIIHSRRVPDLRNAPLSRRRLVYFPRRPAAGLPKRLDRPEALDVLLAALAGARPDLDVQGPAQRLEVHPGDDVP